MTTDFEREKKQNRRNRKRRERKKKKKKPKQRRKKPQDRRKDRVSHCVRKHKIKIHDKMKILHFLKFVIRIILQP